MSPEEQVRAIVDEARAAVAAGREPDADALERRLRAAGADAAAEQRALQQLARVLSVHRARTRVAREPEPPPRPAPAPLRPRRGPIRTRATISANMDVRRAGTADRPRLAWDAAPAVAGWEVRFSERPDARSDYAVRETLTLPPGETDVAVPLTDRPLRVHVLGRSRDGRLLRRAIVSALTRESWGDRWERRASAS